MFLANCISVVSHLKIQLAVHLNTSKALTSLYKPGQIARPMPIGRAKPLRRSRFFGCAPFALQITKTILDLQVFSPIGKTIKKLQ